MYVILHFCFSQKKNLINTKEQDIIAHVQYSLNYKSPFKLELILKASCSQIVFRGLQNNKVHQKIGKHLVDVLERSESIKTAPRSNFCESPLLHVAFVGRFIVFISQKNPPLSMGIVE